MKKQSLILIFCLLTYALWPQGNTTGTIPDRPPYEVKADLRIDLMSLIFRLADNAEYNQGRIESFNKDVDAHFGKFKDHAAVNRARELRKTHGVSFDAVMNLAVHVTDPETLQELVPFAPRPDDLDQRWEIIPAREFLYEARRFVKNSGFAAFSASHRSLYTTTVSRIKEMLQKGRMDWFDSFFGQRARIKLIIVPGLLNDGHSYGVKVKLTDGNEELYCVLGVWLTDRQGLPYFDNSVLSTVIHEFCHSFTNPLVDKYQSQLKNAGQIIFPYVEEAMKRQHYGDWKIMLYESLVRAGVIRYITLTDGQEAAKKQIAQEVNNQFPWIEKLNALLDEYESQRSRYPTLEAFFPRIIAFFNYTAEEIQKKPGVVSMIPTNNTVDVDPTLQTIIINFNRPMNVHSWSIVGGGPKFPEMKGKPFFHSRGTSLSIPVKLKPNWEYEFWLNSEKYFGFVSAEGIPLAPVHIRFKTRSN